MTPSTILDDGSFPILGWAGPSDGMIRDDVMRGMAQAGFTVSHSSVSGGLDEIRRALDVAAGSGVRLLLIHTAWHVGDEYALDGERRSQIRALVEAIRDHPGLYGYHLRDEPRFHLLPLLAEVQAFMRGLDPYHLCYINHFPPIEGWGAPTAEAFWRRYIELAKPQMLSFDHYPVTVGNAGRYPGSCRPAQCLSARQAYREAGFLQLPGTPAQPVQRHGHPLLGFHLQRPARPVPYAD